MHSILHGLLIVTVFAAPLSSTTNEYAKQKVYEEFKDTPALIDTAYCESRFRQFVGTSTEPLLGETTPDDIGVMQINRHFNGAEAERKGIDLASVDGNIAMAKILYKRDGLRPWKSSWSCMLERQKLRQLSE